MELAWLKHTTWILGHIQAEWAIILCTIDSWAGPSLAKHIKLEQAWYESLHFHLWLDRMCARVCMIIHGTWKCLLNCWKCLCSEEHEVVIFRLQQVDVGHCVITATQSEAKTRCTLVHVNTFEFNCASVSLNTQWLVFPFLYRNKVVCAASFFFLLTLYNSRSQNQDVDTRQMIWWSLQLPDEGLVFLLEFLFF